MYIFFFSQTLKQKLFYVMGIKFFEFFVNLWLLFKSFRRMNTGYKKVHKLQTGTEIANNINFLRKINTKTYVIIE